MQIILNIEHDSRYMNNHYISSYKDMQSTILICMITLNHKDQIGIKRIQTRANGCKNETSFTD